MKNCGLTLNIFNNTYLHLQRLLNSKFAIKALRLLSKTMQKSILHVILHT